MDVHRIKKHEDKYSPYLSSVAAKIYFPFGENFTNETGGLLSSTNIQMVRMINYLLLILFNSNKQNKRWPSCELAPN